MALTQTLGVVCDDEYIVSPVGLSNWSQILVTSPANVGQWLF